MTEAVTRTMPQLERLTRGERAEIAYALLRSLGPDDEPTDDELDPTLKGRFEEVHSGSVVCRPFEEVSARLKSARSKDWDDSSCIVTVDGQGRIRVEFDSSIHRAKLPAVSLGPAVMVGKPVIAGTRITVELILEKLAPGESFEQLEENHPHLPPNSIRAAMAFGVGLLRVELRVKRVTFNGQPA